MGTQMKSVTIDGVEFQTDQFPAMHALEVLAQLVRVAGPALSILSSANPETELSDLAPQLGAALSGLKPADANELVRKLLSQTRAFVQAKDGGTRIVELTTEEKINQVFSGKLKVLFQVVGHSIRTNYGDFSEGSGSTDLAPGEKTSGQ